jgi:hypothetical protein
MRQLMRILGIMAVVLIIAAAHAWAANTSTAVTVSATVSATAKLTLNTAAVSFADSDPDTTPLITGAPVVSVTAKGKTAAGSNITLTVLAGDDLKSGTDTIGVANVTWTVAGDGFSAGTMDKSPNPAVSLGSWAGSGNHSGTQTYLLANSWDYATGNYSMTVTYTLTAP